MNKLLSYNEHEALGEKTKASRRSRARIEPLAVLPVFWKLDGLCALVVGATDAAAWKAELLAAAGANVIVVGQDAGEGMAQLVSQPLANGSIMHKARHWRPSDLIDQRMVIADLDDMLEIDQLMEAAKHHAVPYNIIDKPDFCQFQFGSIVNRSPVVIGISTNGAAPILGQNIRRRIEAVVPMSLKVWAEFAQAIRAGVNKHLSPGPQRRYFWESLSREAFMSELNQSYRKSTRQRLSQAVEACSSQRVSVQELLLTSNNPDDLTLRQVRMLQSADSIAYDPRVSSQILQIARREASRQPFDLKPTSGADLYIRFASSE